MSPSLHAAANVGCRLIHTTPSASGAVTILQLIGDCESILHQITGRADWPVGKMRLVSLAGVDEGMAVRLRPRVAQLMPHGGPRVVQRLTAFLIALGVQHSSADDVALDPMDLYPEAQDRIEAITLDALARAESPLAIELLLDQPRRWQKHIESGSPISDEDRSRSARLNRLIIPPTVVLAGRPNVGKSTLSNALMGRSMSIALDQPGTTRDYTAGRIDLAGLVVNWHDTPGLRASDDPIEAKSIEIARRLIAHADMLIALTDVQQFQWPDLPREPDLRVINKCDLADTPEQKPCLTTERGNTERDDRRMLHISAATGQGIAQLVTAIRDHLIPPTDLAHAGRWKFDRRLLTLTNP